MLKIVSFYFIFEKNIKPSKLQEQKSEKNLKLCQPYSITLQTIGDRKSNQIKYDYPYLFINQNLWRLQFNCLVRDY